MVEAISGGKTSPKDQGRELPKSTLLGRARQTDSSSRTYSAQGLSRRYWLQPISSIQGVYLSGFSQLCSSLQSDANACDHDFPFRRHCLHRTVLSWTRMPCAEP